MIHKSLLGGFKEVLRWIYNLSVFLSTILAISVFVFIFTSNFVLLSISADGQDALVIQTVDGYHVFLNDSILFLIKWTTFNIVIQFLYDIYTALKGNLEKFSIQWAVKRNIIIYSLLLSVSGVIYVNHLITKYYELYEQLPQSTYKLLLDSTTNFTYVLIVIFIPIWGTVYYLILRGLSNLFDKMIKRSK